MGLLVIDISNPASMRRVGGNGSFQALDVSVAGDKVFVAAGGDGLVILNTVTPTLRFEPLTRFDAGVFRFSLNGPSGQSARVQRSDNLRDWQNWQTVTVGNGPIEVADPDVSANVKRFYRTISP